jgi:hypothetical protein
MIVRSLLLVGSVLGCACSRQAPAPPPPLKDLTRGKAHVTSSPAGAAIEIGAVPTGLTTPADVTTEVGKDNAIGVRLAGYLPAARVVNPDLNQIPAVHFELQPGASVNVTSDPSGAEVWLADKLQFPSTPGALDALPPGTHLLRLKKDGFADATQTVRISGNDPINVHVKLLPASYLRVETEPDGAAIYVDGVSSGVSTPALRLALVANARHRVEVRKQGFASATRMIPARRPGEAGEASFTLQEVRLINVRARLKGLEADLRKWTARRDALERKQEGNFVIRDAHKELDLKRKLDEASEQVESITAEVESAREQIESLKEAGAREREIKSPR